MLTSHIVKPSEMGRELARGWLADPLSWRKVVLIDESDDGTPIDAFYDALLQVYLDDESIGPVLRLRLGELLASTGRALFMIGAGTGYGWIRGSRINAEAGEAINALIEAASQSGDPRLAEMPQPHGFHRSRLSVEFGVEYRATIRALLPRFRQVELDGEFDLPGRIFLPSAYSDFAPFGQNWFFTVSLCLMLQSFLTRHGISLPVAIVDGVMDGFDSDWRRAVWRMIMGTMGPIVVVGREHVISAAEWDSLARADWTVGATQIGRVRQRTGAIWGVTGVVLKELIERGRRD